MSDTGFQINGDDLISIYNTNGNKSGTATGFKAINGNDLNTIFGAYIANTNKYTTTGAYTFGSDTKTDLKDFFLFATVSYPPTALDSPSKTGTSISLSWTAPISNGGSPITGYIVYYGSNNVNTGTTATTYNLSGLSNGTPYSIYVVAVNNVGNSGNSNTISVTTNSKPSAPTSLSSSSVTSSSFTVNWLEPSSDGGSLIQNYSVNGNIVTSTTRSYGFSNLQPATLYTITIFAINAVGNGTTASINITTSATFPSAPTSLSSSNVTSSSIPLTWTAPTSTGGSNILKYLVKYTTNSLTTTIDTLKTDTSFTLTGLNFFTSYSISVVAKNGIGESVDSTAISVTTNKNILTVTHTNEYNHTGNQINLIYSVQSNGTTLSNTFYTVTGTTYATNYNILQTQFYHKNWITSIDYEMIDDGTSTTVYTPYKATITINDSYKNFYDPNTKDIEWYIKAYTTAISRETPYYGDDGGGDDGGGGQSECSVS